MENNKDLTILRDLAKQYMEISNKDIQEERRRLWRDHNSLKKTRPLVQVGFPPEEIPECQPKCEDPFCRQYEQYFLHRLYRIKLVMTPSLSHGSQSGHHSYMADGVWVQDGSDPKNIVEPQGLTTRSRILRTLQNS